MNKLLVITVKGVTLKLPITVSYKHYVEDEISDVVEQFGCVFGDKFAYLEDIEDSE